MRSLVLVPLPQVDEQRVQSPHSLHSQGVGQAAVPHTCACLAEPLQGLPSKAAWTETRRFRNDSPPPQLREHLDHCSQWSHLQSTEHGLVLQLSLSSILPSQTSPPHAAAVLTARVRVAFPPPQEALHAAHGPQLAHSQLTGQPAGLHGLSSFAEPSQGLPPCLPAWDARLLDCRPVPQLAEHEDQAVHVLQVQSTGHGAGLQGSVILSLPSQRAPPFCAGTCTRRWWLLVPLPHVAEHLSHSPQGPSWQATAQACVLHASVSFLVPVQGFPLCLSGLSTSRVLDQVPPPQVAEQLAQSPQWPSLQSEGHSSVLQAFCSSPAPVQGDPPLAACARTSRLRLVMPPPHVCVQTDQASHLPQRQSLAQGCVPHDRF